MASTTMTTTTTEQTLTLTITALAAHYGVAVPGTWQGDEELEVGVGICRPAGGGDYGDLSGWAPDAQQFAELAAGETPVEATGGEPMSERAADDEGEGEDEAPTCEDCCCELTLGTAIHPRSQGQNHPTSSSSSCRRCSCQCM